MDPKEIKDRIPSPDRFDELTQEEQKAIWDLNSIKVFKKGEILIEEGKQFNHSYFVVDGCVRQYRLVDGEDITSEFYTADQTIFTPTSSSKDKTAKYNLECLEECRISVVSFEKEQLLYRQFPRFQQMCRIASEANLIDYQAKFSDFISSTPEERYLNILKNRPDLIQRVPQYHLASYLGIKPESLSRIRKRLAN